MQISEKGIDRCIKAYNAENLMISREWLLTGEGLGNVEDCLKLVLAL